MGSVYGKCSREHLPSILIGTPGHPSAIIHSASHVTAVQRITSWRYSSRPLVNLHIKHQNGGAVWFWLWQGCCFEYFRSWWSTKDFQMQQSQEFTQYGAEKKKTPLSVMHVETSYQWKRSEENDHSLLVYSKLNNNSIQPWWSEKHNSLISNILHQVPLFSASNRNQRQQ